MTTPGGVPNLPMGALTLDTLADTLQNMTGAAMKSRAVERFPSIMDNSTGLSPASDITPFGILTRIWAEVNSLVANADPADIDGPEDLPPLLLDFIEGLPVVGQFVGIIEAILGTYDGDDEVLLSIQEWFGHLRSFFGAIDFSDPDFDPIDAVFVFIEDVLLPNGLQAAITAPIQAVIDFIINALTGGSHTGHPFELLQTVFANLGNSVTTAVTAANQAADVARQLGQYVIQIVQSLEETPIIGDFAELVNTFAFWVLGWFGITQQSVTDTNPAVAALGGRVGALEAINTPGFEGFHDHFNRPVIGSDWVTITPYNPLNILNSEALKSYNHCAGRYDAANLITDNWHVQWTFVYPDFGQSRIFVSTNGVTAESSFTNGLCIDVSYQSFGTVITLYTMSGGLISGMTQRRQYNFGDGVVKIGDVFAIEYYEADDTFYFFRNNEEVPNLRWPDGAGIVSHGVGHREIAVLTNLANNASFSGPGFDDMSVYDIKVT